jgi:predicted ATPase
MRGIRVINEIYVDRPPFQKGLNLKLIPGINVFIGENGIGKSVLLWELSRSADNQEMPLCRYLNPGEAVGVMVAPSLTEAQKAILQSITALVGKEIKWFPTRGEYLTYTKDGKVLTYYEESSGINKLAYLGLLVSCGFLDPGTIFCWDDADLHIHPGMFSDLAKILLALAKSGVQIFLTTHSELFCEYLALERQEENEVMFYSLYREDEILKVEKDTRFDLLELNPLSAEAVKVYEKRIAKTFPVW